MNHDELKEALLNRWPIVHAGAGGDIAYERVSAIIYRTNDKNRIVISAELADKCGHSVSIVDPARARYKEG